MLQHGEAAGWPAGSGGSLPNSVCPTALELPMDDRTAFACQVFDHMPLRRQLVIPWIAFFFVSMRKKYCFQMCILSASFL